MRGPVAVTKSPSIIILAVLTMLGILQAHAATIECLVYNVTLPQGLNSSAVAAVAAPGSWGSVGLGSPTSPVNYTIMRIDGYTVAVWRWGLQPGSYTVYLCNASLSHGPGLPYAETGVLRVTCPGVYENQTGDNYGYGSTSLSFTVGSPWSIVYDIFYYVYVYVIYPPATLNVTICYDGGCTTRLYTLSNTINTISQSISVWWNATRVDVYASVAGGYYSYVYLYTEVYYITPTYNETNVTIGYFDYARVSVAGRGYVLASGRWLDVNGSAVIYATPYGAALNGSPLGFTFREVTIGTSCFGVNETAVLVYTVEYGNATVYDYSLLGSESIVVQPQGAQIGYNVTLNVNNTQVAVSINRAAMVLGSVAVVGLGAAAIYAPQIEISIMLSLASLMTGAVVTYATGEVIVVLVALAFAAFNIVARLAGILGG